MIGATGAAWTWSGNSRENRLTPFSNDAVSEFSGEAVYLRDAMHEVVNMMGEQEQAVGGINTSVNGLFELSAETSKQTEMLHGLSAKLNEAAADLGHIVDKFKL